MVFGVFTHNHDYSHDLKAALEPNTPWTNTHTQSSNALPLSLSVDTCRQAGVTIMPLYAGNRAPTARDSLRPQGSLTDTQAV